MADLSWPLTLADWNARWDGKPHHKIAVATFAGTWAIPGDASGTGFPSQFAQRLDRDVFVEVPIDGPYSMGPIGGPPDAPSYMQGVAITSANFKKWFLSLPAWQLVVIAGYSQGAEDACRVWQMFLTDPALKPHAWRIVGLVCWGNPCRPEGVYVGSLDPGGRGISDNLLDPTTLPPNTFFFCNKGDMYSSVPDGLEGQYMTDVYRLVVRAQINDFAQFVQDMIQQGQYLFGDVAELVGKIASGHLINAEEIAAAKAAIYALQFMASGTAAHVTYNSVPVPGDGRDSVTYAVDTFNYLGPRLLPPGTYMHQAA